MAAKRKAPKRTAPKRKNPAAINPNSGLHSAVTRQAGRPIFSQPSPTEDPTTFAVPHASDGQAYKAIDALNKAHKLQPMPFPVPRGGTEPQITLQQVLGDIDGSPPDIRATARDTVKTITNSGQIVFHSLG